MQNDQVRALRYAVVWSDQHPMSWLEGAFPVSYTVDGWHLSLEESELVAEPSVPMAADEAMEALTPILSAWQASLEITEHLVVTFTYRGADPVLVDGGSVLGTDVVAATFNASVAVKRPSPPAPSWEWKDTEVTSAARELCLRPVRRGTRTVPDAAYWLLTHLKAWAGSEAKAADRLNVSRSYMKHFRTQGARSSERKVGTGMKVSTEGEKAALAKVLEELVLRLHLVESGLRAGEFLTR
ncbi:hypothetical protein [Kitasatospora griseola]|uniref:hypothetical protein n=1 Tax=Kitasatospora griseola TaxID=2064 RepID=UPI00343D611B